MKRFLILITLTLSGCYVRGCGPEVDYFPFCPRDPKHEREDYFTQCVHGDINSATLNRCGEETLQQFCLWKPAVFRQGLWIPCEGGSLSSSEAGACRRFIDRYQPEKGDL